jgi:threonine synthase
MQETPDLSWPLLDAPSVKEIALAKETVEARKILSDATLSLVDRVESFEDIIDLEVGDTPLTRLRNVERETGLRQLFAKFEGGNPTGTQKDRIAFAQCHDAMRRQFSTITVATCGNYGASMAVAAYLAQLDCHVVIPESYHSKRVEMMQQFGAKVVRVPGTYEDAVKYSVKLAQDNDWYDGNPGGVNTPLQLLAYAEIAYEIYDSLRDAPKYVGVPVSNGTLLAGVYRGFVSLYKRGRTSRIPKMLAGSSARKNPIVYSFKKSAEGCEDLDPKIIRETSVNEPLVNWHSFDGEEALYAIRQSQGGAEDVSDEKMNRLTKLLRDKEGLRTLPASTAGLAAMLSVHQRLNLEPDRFVVILTGRR